MIAAIATPIGLITASLFFLLWPHAGCADGCKSGHWSARAGNEGMLFASVLCLVATLFSLAVHS
jgi:hypothetical protein